MTPSTPLAKFCTNYSWNPMFLPNKNKSEVRISMHHFHWSGVTIHGTTPWCTFTSNTVRYGGPQTCHRCGWFHHAFTNVSYDFLVEASIFWRGQVILIPWKNERSQRAWTNTPSKKVCTVWRYPSLKGMIFQQKFPAKTPRIASLQWRFRSWSNLLFKTSKSCNWCGRLTTIQ